MITTESLLDAQNRSDLSNQTLLNLATTFRENGVKVEPGLKSSLKESGKIFEEHFEVRKIDMEVKVEDKIVIREKSVVVCKNVDAFVEEVKTKRKIKGPVTLKFGADGGGETRN